MSQAPQMAPYARHVLICTGRYCDPNGDAERLYHKLQSLLGDLGDYWNPVRVKRGKTPCLGVCAGGPIVVVYPDGIWYHHVDENVLERIVDEHLRQNQPVEEFVFHRLWTHPTPTPTKSILALADTESLANSSRADTPDGTDRWQYLGFGALVLTLLVGLVALQRGGV